MEEKRKKIPFNTGKLEFIAAMDEIQPLFSMGHTKLHIYNEMAKCGKFTMSYDTFCYHMKNFYADKVKRLDILKDGDIDPRAFDELINIIAELPLETHVMWTTARHLFWRSTAI